jgi:hypothetical protein
MQLSPENSEFFKLAVLLKRSKAERAFMMGGFIFFGGKRAPKFE